MPPPLSSSRAAEQTKGIARPPVSRTAEQWTALERSAFLMAQKRERDYLHDFFKSHKWRMCDLAAALGKLQLIEAVFDTKEIYTLHMAKVRELMKDLEKEKLGIEFGLFLHYELRIPIPQIVRITQAGSKTFHRYYDYSSMDRDGDEESTQLAALPFTGAYKSDVLLQNPFLKNDSVSVPRIAPPRSILEPAMRRMECRLLDLMCTTHATHQEL